MKIGISSACFYPKFNTEECIPIMKKMGFNLGEIFFNSPCEYESSFVERILQQKEEYNFKINSVHAFCAAFEPFLFDRYKRRRNDMFKYFKAVCKAAKLLDASCYTFHGLRAVEYKNLDSKFIVDIYDELCYTACEEGIKLAQENVSWCMSSDVSFLHMLKTNCKYPIYFTFDVKQAYKAGRRPEDYINIMGDKLINFHINDRDEQHVCLLPGDGNVDYLRIKEQLQNINYKGNLIIEIYGENYKEYKQIEKSRDMLSDILLVKN